MREKKKRKNKKKAKIYGKAIHAIIEYPNAKFLSIKELKKFLRVTVGYVPQDVLEIIWKKMHDSSILVRFKKWLEEKIEEGFMYVPERFIMLRSSHKLQILRPDIVLKNNEKKHLIIVEIKSGKRWKKKQVEKYIKAYRSLLSDEWKIEGYVFLIGSKKFFKVRM